MATVIANSTGSSQVEMVQIASAQFGSPSIEPTSSQQAQVVQTASPQSASLFPVQTTSSPQAHVVQIASAQFRRPLLELIQDTRQYLDKCVPLHKVALKGDWNAGRRMIVEDRRLLNAAIIRGWGTLLHVAAGANHVHFVKELIELLDPYDLELQDYNGNTSLCYAAASGNLQIADMMIHKNECLPHIRGGEGVTPLCMAALQGKSDMARYLYTLTKDIFEEDDWNIMFFLSINNGLYGEYVNCQEYLLKL